MNITSILNGLLMEEATQRLMFSEIIMDYKVTTMRDCHGGVQTQRDY